MSNSNSSRTPAAAISRMPATVQDSISQALADGATWRTIADIAATAGFPGVTAQNVTNFRKGAHKKWLARQERLATARAAYAWKIELLNKYKAEGGPAEAGLAAAMDMLESALSDISASDISALIADQPHKIFDIMRMLVSLRREMADLRREDRESAAIAQSLPSHEKKGLTAEDCRRIEAAMNLL